MSTFRLIATALTTLPLLACVAAVAQDETPPQLYAQRGTDVSFAALLEAGAIPVGRNSTEGVEGSMIDVDNVAVERGPCAGNPIPRDIRIHTLGNSAVGRQHFGRWSRWFQEDGNTQVFRLFAGEHNVRNDRPDAARIEAFSGLTWEQGPWHTWEGDYTIIKPHACAIFQVKNIKNDWAVMLNLSDAGDLTLNHRRHQEDRVIARDVAGKSFHLRVRDNGREYEVFLDGEAVGAGHYNRPEGHTAFRWGMYDKTVRHDALIFVTGARFE